jgi:GNAT superfamily N-acetyltransferase
LPSGAQVSGSSGSRSTALITAREAWSDMFTPRGAPATRVWDCQNTGAGHRFEGCGQRLLGLRKATLPFSTRRNAACGRRSTVRRRASDLGWPSQAGCRYGDDVAADGVELYRSSFVRRSAAMSMPDEVVISEPGMCGVLGSSLRPSGRLLITDDRAVAHLETMVPAVPARIITVFAEAARCRMLIEDAARWHGEDATAMICRDLSEVPVLPSPLGLTIRPVYRAPGDPVDGVPLEHAAQACLRADPETAGHPLPGFLAFLHSLPLSTRLLAAVDEQNLVRATAGSSALGADANAYVVSTDEQWRHRGVATAMTSAALSWARDAGARQACLDASAAGLSIYLRLGFQAVASATIFARFS